MKPVVTIDPTKSVLIVEDNVARVHWFRDKLEGMDVTVATNVDEALRVLGLDFKYDIIFLDHDAVPVYMNQYDESYHKDSFWLVAMRLAEMKFSGDVLIHSWNVLGSRRMEHVLGRTARVVRIPFGQFDLVKE